MEISACEPNSNFESVLSLCTAAEWSAYTAEPARLREALKNSSLVLIAKKNDKIVGFIRRMLDEQSICYIQGILVHPKHHRHGIGKSLMQRVLNYYASCRQIVLMTDARQSEQQFYESSGFREIAGDLRGYVLLRPRAFSTPTAPLPF